jgi:hypothetical protein
MPGRQNWKPGSSGHGHLHRDERFQRLRWLDYAFVYCSNLQGVYFKGNPPAADTTVFSGDTATNYYLPAATGWVSPFAGLPAVLWNPQFQLASPTFGIHTNLFGFTITGNSNLVFVVTATTNLVSPAWTPLQTNSLTNGVFYFSDSQWRNYPRRFYRLTSP